jgi:hypothetical protein
VCLATPYNACRVRKGRRQEQRTQGMQVEKWSPYDHRFELQVYFFCNKRGASVFRICSRNGLTFVYLSVWILPITNASALARLRSWSKFACRDQSRLLRDNWGCRIAALGSSLKRSITHYPNPPSPPHVAGQAAGMPGLPRLESASSNCTERLRTARDRRQTKSSVPLASWSVGCQ